MLPNRGPNHRFDFYKYYKITNLNFLNVKLEYVIILLIKCYHVLNMNLIFICVKFKFNKC
jgi:hypothetical protein